MRKNLFSISVLLFLVLLCPAGYAAEKKILAALIDFADGTPNKMSLTADENFELSNAHLAEVRQIIRESTEKSGLFELLPRETVAEAMNTQIGIDAVARRYDRFSAARLGKMLGVDVILTGEIVHFGKDTVSGNLTISGLDFSDRTDDVIIKAQLINAHNGEELANVTGRGTASENVLDTMSAAAANRLSTGFLQATRASILRILREFETVDIKIE